MTMISSDHGDFIPPVDATDERRKVDLSAYDGERIAVIFDRNRQRIVLQGTATFIYDDAVGNALNIQLDNDEPGQPVLVIAEDEWEGRVIPDFHHGCKFSLIFD